MKVKGLFQRTIVNCIKSDLATAPRDNPIEEF